MSLLIECPACQWHPTSSGRWQCSCGNRWNTFATQGKCPACGIQWTETDCLRCGRTAPHQSWYREQTLPSVPETPETAELTVRKHRIEQRLVAQGIQGYPIDYLPYLSFSPADFQTPYAVGCRLLILYVLSIVVHELDRRPEVIAWFKDEQLWKQVSAQEKEFLRRPKPTDREMAAISWHLEGALILGWALNIIPVLPEAVEPATDEVLDELFTLIPSFGSATSEFLHQVSFRPLEEIIDENLFHEMATGYFRDLYLNGGADTDTSAIHRAVSFERHRTLNWVRQYAGIADWDETDTST